MLLFSKRAKYIIYTFVIKVFKQKKVLEEIKALHLQKSAIITTKKGLLIISLVKTTNFREVQNNKLL